MAQPVAFLLASLGITKSHSRPHASDDNPFSEAHVKTLKYRPDFPERFASLEHARAFLRDFFAWYNTQHHHDALALLTPHDVHHGLVAERISAHRVDQRHDGDEPEDHAGHVEETFALAQWNPRRRTLVLSR